MYYLYLELIINLFDFSSEVWCNIISVQIVHHGGGAVCHTSCCIINCRVIVIDRMMSVCFCPVIWMEIVVSRVVTTGKQLGD